MTVDGDELNTRLAHRDKGGWGHELYEREDSLSMMNDFNDNIRQMSPVEINTDQPVQAIVEQIMDNL